MAFQRFCWLRFVTFSSAQYIRNHMDHKLSVIAFHQPQTWLMSCSSLNSNSQTQRSFHVCGSTSSILNYNLDINPGWPTQSKSQLILSDKRIVCIRKMNGAVLTKFAKDIDLDKLRQEFKKKSEESRENINFVNHWKKLIAQKCAEAVENLNDEEKKRLQVLKLEHNFLFSEGNDIPDPSCMQDEHWLEAMNMISKNQRLRYYLYLQKRDYTKKNSEKKKAADKLMTMNTKSREKYEHGRLFMRIYPRTMKKWLNHRLAHAMQYGTPLVLDMDYVDVMRPQEQKNTAKQLQDVYDVNRQDPKQDPFHLFFANCSENNLILKLLQLRGEDDPILLATVSEKSYLDLFEKDKLVYLTPHAVEPMVDFDKDKVYIVGAFNDKAIQKPISYARAVEHGLKCQRLPIDEHVRWQQGSKSLTLNQVTKILLDKKNRMTWKQAFSCIPQRKVRPKEDA